MLPRNTAPALAERKFLREYAVRWVAGPDGRLKLQQRLNDGSDNLEWFDVPVIEEVPQR